MTMNIDPSKTPRENLLALVNHANSSDLTTTDVALVGIDPIAGRAEGERNTTVMLDPTAEGRFSVAAGGVTINYRRLSFAELIQRPVELKAIRSTTLTEIHQAICNAYGLIPDGVLTEGTLPSNGTILPGETFEVTINPSVEGSLVYFPKSKQITITWDGVWLEALLANSNLPGYKAANDEIVITLVQTDHSFTPSKLDELVSAQAGGWSNNTPLKIIIKPGLEIVSKQVPETTLPADVTPTFNLDAKYAVFPSILIENHGDLFGGGSNGTRERAPAPGRDAIVVAAALGDKVSIDNYGRIAGGGGGGGGTYNGMGGGGAPFGSGAQKATLTKGGEGVWNNPYNYSGNGGDIGKNGNPGYGSNPPGGTAGKAIRGKVTFINRGTIIGQVG